MQLAVLSYPKHYHITQMAVRHALKYIPNIDRIFVIWDDTHVAQPEIPLRNLLKMQFNLPECPGILWSHLIPYIEGNRTIEGNVGQQIIKLHLDLIIKGDFIILDGDTIINHPIDPQNIFYSNRLPITHKRFNLINYSLGIPNYEFFSNTFMFVKNQWLRDLRNHIKITTGLSIARLFDLQYGNNPVYEWELIAHYVLDILKIPKKVEYFDKVFLETEKFEKNFTLDNNLVLKGSDNFSPNFMEKHGITVDKQLMMQLNYSYV